MVGLSRVNDVCFEVQTPLGFIVRVTVTYWQFIVSVKHPVMAGREADVQDTLRDPCEIRRSRSDPSVYLFYGLECRGRRVCAVVRQIDEEVGFLITTYPTDAVKEGTRIWSR